MDQADQVDQEPLHLTDEEMQTVLEAMAFYRNEKLRERAALSPAEGKSYHKAEMPPADRLEGQIRRAGALVAKLSRQAARRKATQEAAEKRGG